MESSSSLIQLHAEVGSFWNRNPAAKPGVAAVRCPCPLPRQQSSLLSSLFKKNVLSVFVVVRVRAQICIVCFNKEFITSKQNNAFLKEKEV
jgi:hypothetical protein